MYYQDIASKRKADLSKAFPAYKQFSHDPRLYEKNGKEEVNISDSELLEYLNSGQMKALDLQMLMKAEEELSQTRGFIRIFPSASTFRQVEMETMSLSFTYLITDTKGFLEKTFMLIDYYRFGRN